MNRKIKQLLVNTPALVVLTLGFAGAAGAAEPGATYQKYLNSVTAADLHRPAQHRMARGIEVPIKLPIRKRDDCDSFCAARWQSPQLDAQVRAEVDSFNTAMSSMVMGSDFPGQLAFEIRRRPQLSMSFHFN